MLLLLTYRLKCKNSLFFFTMNLIGLVQALLINIRLLTGLNDPQYKVTPVGFLQMLLENPVTAKIANEKQIREGQDLELKVRYMQRGLESEIEDEDNCDTSISATWLESSIGRPLLSKAGIFISDEEMRKYQVEATATIAAGTNIQAPMMVALYETIMVKANGLIQSINSKLLTAQAAKWGTNAAYGDANAHTLNFGNSMVMDDGLVKLLLDGQANEVNGELILVGNGVVNAYQTLQNQKVGVDSFGFAKGNFKVYNDVGSAPKWGANHFGAFAQGLVGLVDFNKNVGNYAGEKGGSIFFTLPIPVQLANGNLSTLVLDAQMKYQDCPVFNEAQMKIADRGWKLILSKSFGLWNAPDNMFAATDRLAGFNGSMHYVGAIATNVVNIQPTAEAIFKTDEIV